MQNVSGIQSHHSSRGFFPGRRYRPWVSYMYTACQHDQLVYVVMRCPVVNGIALLHAAWQHKIVPAY